MCDGLYLYIFVQSSRFSQYLEALAIVYMGKMLHHQSVQEREGYKEVSISKV